MANSIRIDIVVNGDQNGAWIFFPEVPSSNLGPYTLTVDESSL